MQLARGWRRLAVVSATLTLALLGIVSVGAQDSNTHRFFGFSGDVTIDDQPLAEGAEIVAMVDDVEIGRAKVNRAGAWILDVSTNDLKDSPCNVTFVFDGYRVDPGWDVCELRVRLAVTTPDGAQAQQTEDSSDASADADEREAQAAQTDGAQLTSDDDDTEPGSSQEREIVRPAPPATGTGGVLAAEQSTNWPRAAAITALLMLAISVLALVISWRTDSRS